MNTVRTLQDAAVATRWYQVSALVIFFSSLALVGGFVVGRDTGNRPLESPRPQYRMLPMPDPAEAGDAPPALSDGRDEPTPKS